MQLNNRHLSQFIQPLSLVVFLLVAACSFAQPQPTLHLNTKVSSHYDTLGTIPPFRFYADNGHPFTPDNLKKGYKTVLMYFDPDCESCEFETGLILDNIKKFGKTQFLLITAADSGDTHKFIVEEGADQFDNLHVLHDKDENYMKFYVMHYTPSLHIFDESGHLIIFNDGRLSEEELEKYLAPK